MKTNSATDAVSVLEPVPTVTRFTRTRDSPSLDYRLQDYYLVGRKVGSGSFGKVFEGVCLRTFENRAIKTIERENDERSQKNLAREILISKTVDHPNLVKSFDIFESDRYVDIAMEYVQDGSLLDALEFREQRGTFFNEGQCAQIIRGILTAVLYLQKNGIVHRDIKLENVLLDDMTLDVKVADFGLSDIHHSCNDMVMTESVGTIPYWAPELARGGEYNEKVDLWAIGIIMSLLLTGDSPLGFYKEDSELIEDLCNVTKVQLLTESWSGHTEQAQSFLKSLLNTDPYKRLTALGALNHTWISHLDPLPPIVISRASIIEMVDAGVDIFEIRRIVRARDNCPKNLWHRAFVAIRFLVRLGHTAHSERR